MPYGHRVDTFHAQSAADKENIAGGSHRWAMLPPTHLNVSHVRCRTRHHILVHLGVRGATYYVGPCRFETIAVGLEVLCPTVLEDAAGNAERAHRVASVGDVRSRSSCCAQNRRWFEGRSVSGVSQIDGYGVI